jgi:beta-galactosidase/beta-glucuronidase
MSTALRRPLALLGLFAISLTVTAADWKPAAAPLMTKWGKQVKPENAWQEYPRPQLERKDWQNLNGLWDYAITGKDAAKPEKWDGQILVPFCAESALSGVGKSVTPNQLLWYHRKLDMPQNWNGKKILLNFGAVDWESHVFVNDKEVGTHKGGSDPFSFDITSFLVPGENHLVVRVWDPTDSGSQPRGKQKFNQEGIWYTPVTGIWQTVWMEPVNETRIESIESVTAADLKTVTLHFKSKDVKDGDQIRVHIDYPTAPEKGTFELTQAYKDVFEIGQGDIRLWTPDTPHVYGLTVSILRNREVVDSVKSYFTKRTVTAAKDDQGVLRLMLNGKPVFQIGPLDQGWWPDGLLTPPSDAAMKYDLEVLKKLGMNMLRKHIKVEPARYYKHCDELGLIVWQDMPSGMATGKHQEIRRDATNDAKFDDADKKQFRAELKAMIDHLRVFPCIAVWVPFNEGWGQHDTNDILKWVKEYDPNRLVNGPSGWTDRGYGDLKDMHRYPGPDMFPPMPDRVSVLGEFGGLGLALPGHLWKDSKNWGYRSFKTKEELRQNYHQLMLRLHPLIGRGLAAAIYTQTTDVEIEINGLMTYDREVIKYDIADMAKWHKMLHDTPPVYKDLVPTSETTAQKWRMTLEKPADGWEKPDFNAASWKENDGGFGTSMTPGSVVKTEWKTNDIWIRRNFELKEAPSGEVLLRIHYDDECEVSINGIPAVTLRGYTTAYVEAAISGEARKSLKAGGNTIAIHAHQERGGQYIDAGLVTLTPAK